MATMVLKVSGMKCGGCETQVREAVEALAGVASARASLAEGSVEVEYDPAEVSIEAITKAISERGYAVV